MRNHKIKRPIIKKFIIGSLSAGLLAGGAAMEMMLGAAFVLGCTVLLHRLCQRNSHSTGDAGNIICTVVRDQHSTAETVQKD